MSSSRRQHVDDHIGPHVFKIVSDNHAKIVDNPCLDSSP